MVSKTKPPSLRTPAGPLPYILLRVRVAVLEARCHAAPLIFPTPVRPVFRSFGVRPPGLALFGPLWPSSRAGSKNTGYRLGHVKARNSSVSNLAEIRSAQRASAHPARSQARRLNCYRRLEGFSFQEPRSSNCSKGFFADFPSEITAPGRALTMQR